jgi:PIN domain nuclease of toxin-antitoxin system
VKQTLLLDTCACIWFSQGFGLKARARQDIDLAINDGLLWLSPFSAWEIANLAGRGRFGVDRDPLIWFRELIALTRGRLANLDIETLVESQTLPGPIHKDPADRIMIATARRLNATLVTRDRLIEAYAALGHVRVLPC